jgi:hypothetical protein
MTTHSELAERVAEILESMRGECLRDEVFKVLHRRILAALDEAVRKNREASYKVLCSSCAEGIPMKDDKHHVGDIHCYSWALRARGDAEGK